MIAPASSKIAKAITTMNGHTVCRIDGNPGAISFHVEYSEGEAIIRIGGPDGFMIDGDELTSDKPDVVKHWDDLVSLCRRVAERSRAGLPRSQTIPPKTGQG